MTEQTMICFSQLYAFTCLTANIHQALTLEDLLRVEQTCIFPSQCFFNPAFVIVNSDGNVRISVTGSI